MKAIIACAVIALATPAHATGREETLKLQAGMTVEQVVAILGQPDSKRLRNGEECLMYSFWRDFWNRRPGDYSDRYFACLRKGRLTDFGMVEDRF